MASHCLRRSLPHTTLFDCLQGAERRVYFAGKALSANPSTCGTSRDSSNIKLSSTYRTYSTTSTTRTSRTSSNTSTANTTRSINPTKRHALNFSTTPANPLSYASIPSCPEPTCTCAPTPSLDIDQTSPITNTAPYYDQHVVIATGKSDWRSRIEDEGAEQAHKSSKPSSNSSNRDNKFSLADFKDGKVTKDASSRNNPSSTETPSSTQDASTTEQTSSPSTTSTATRETSLARGVKTNLGPKGQYFNPTRTVLVTASSFPLDKDTGAAPEVSALLFPSFLRVSGIRDTPAGHRDFTEKFLTATSSLTSDARSDAQTTQQTTPTTPYTISPVRHPVVLICSHHTRDVRCGVLGPLLHAEFVRQLEENGVPAAEESVAMCSHVGGHKWAGNVIIYLPSEWTEGTHGKEFKNLGGRGVWYSRVEPRHVQGLVRETVLEGRVVEELCRGVI